MSTIALVCELTLYALRLCEPVTFELWRDERDFVIARHILTKQQLAQHQIYDEIEKRNRFRFCIFHARSTTNMMSVVLADKLRKTFFVFGDEIEDIDFFPSWKTSQVEPSKSVSGIRLPQPYNGVKLFLKQALTNDPYVSECDFNFEFIQKMNQSVLDEMIIHSDPGFFQRKDVEEIVATKLMNALNETSIKAHGRLHELAFEMQEIYDTH